MAVPTLEGEMLNWGRLLLDGIPFADMLECQRRDASIPWFDFWLRKASHYEELAEEALADDNTVSAGEWLWLASLCCQYAQFLWFDERRSEGQRRKAELYRLAAPHLMPHAERVELPFEGHVIPGYLRLPARSEQAPCAVVLGGLESTKEESHRFENLLLDRGVATFTFDGPGQGELLEDLPLAGDFHRYASAVVDHLVGRSELDADRLGVLGRSLGGFYALQSASREPRFKACVAWGGFVDLDAWENQSPATREAWRYACKVATEAEAREIVRRTIDCRPTLDGLRCPTYLLHGALDDMPLSQVEELRTRAVNAPLTIRVEPAGDHCCHNLGPEPRVRMADWLTNHLR